MKTLKLLTVLSLCSILFTKCEKEEATPPPSSSAGNFEDSLKNGLWGFYNFDNRNFSDLSGKGHHMVGVNNVKFGVDLWGNVNNALEFDGQNQYAVIDSGKQFPEGDFAISFLMMPKFNSGRIFQKANLNDARGASFGVGYDIYNTGKLVFNISKDNNVCSAFTDESTSTPLTVQKVIFPYAWYQVVVQHSNSVEKVYINGKLVASQLTPNSSFKNCTTAPFYLGIWWLQDVQQFLGKVDDLRIYTRALSENEISYLFTRMP